MCNFGEIKNKINHILAESIVNKDDSARFVFKKYVKLLNEDKFLKKQFLLFNLIENKVEPDIEKAKFFVNETFDLVNEKKEYKKSNNKLFELVKTVDVDVEKNELYENIDYLINTNKNINVIENIVNAKSFITNYIMNNTTKKEVNEDYLPNSLLSSVYVDNFNEEYQNLNETEQEVLKSIINEDDKQELFLKLNNECLELLNEKLKNDNDFEVKKVLLDVKEQLLENKINSETILRNDVIESFSKLIELKETLK